MGDCSCMLLHSLATVTRSQQLWVKTAFLLYIYSLPSPPCYKNQYILNRHVCTQIMHRSPRGGEADLFLPQPTRRLTSPYITRLHCSPAAQPGKQSPKGDKLSGTFYFCQLQSFPGRLLPLPFLFFPELQL